MNRHIIIITTDKRQEALGELLSGERKRCSWEEYERDEICEKIYVLPTPTNKLDGNKEFCEKLKEELTNCKGPLMVFGGVFTKAWKDFLEKNGIVYWDFMQQGDVVEGNGWITAEGTLAEVLKYSPYSIAGQRVLITGYGCCGEKLATVFHALGAKVVIAARRESVRREAVLDGYSAVSFEELPAVVGHMDTVINTVPAMVMDETVLKAMDKDCLIIDIASKPGGTDFAVAKALGIEAHLALGLPGIYSTRSSAELFKDVLMRYAPLENDNREVNTWIFQIIM